MFTKQHELAEGQRGVAKSGFKPQLALLVNIPVVIAWFEEMQAMVTVWAGVLSEKPAPKAAYEQKRTTVKTCTFCSTGPDLPPAQQHAFAD